MTQKIIKDFLQEMVNQDNRGTAFPIFYVIRDFRKEFVDDGVDYELKPYIVENSLFLTESDAENHLKQNSYHYSKEAHTYVMHACRAPALSDFFKALFEYFNIKGE